MTKKTAASRRALAIRHVAFEDLGSFAPVLRARGVRIAYRDAGRHDLAKIDALSPDLLVMLGGPIGACEENAYPFLRDELRLIEKRLAAKKPILGICLGAQLMARVLGARVYPGPKKELGWGPLALTPEGTRSCLKHLAPQKTQVLHWHGDTFDLPKGAVRLASSDVCINQAFSAGPKALALQFHAEARGPDIERWLIGHAGEIAAAGVAVAAIRDETAKRAPALEVQGPRCFAAFLDAASLKSHLPTRTKRTKR